MNQEGGAPSGARRVVAAVSRGLDVVQRGLIAVVVAVAATSALLLFWQVTDRMLFQGGQNWIDEFARLSLIWMTFLGAAVLIRERRHLAVDYFVDKFGPRARGACQVATDLLILGLVTLLLLQAGSVLASGAVLRSPSLGIPRSVLVSAALVSYALTAVYCLESLVRAALRMPPVEPVVRKIDEAAEPTSTV